MRQATGGNLTGEFGHEPHLHARLLLYLVEGRVWDRVVRVLAILRQGNAVAQLIHRVPPHIRATAHLESQASYQRGRER